MANYGTRYVKKKTPWLAFALMLIVFLILGYLISGVYVAPKELKGDYNAQLLWAFTHPIKAANSKSPAWVGIGFIAWFFFVNYYMIHYRNFHSEMEHGDEDWLDPVKASRELKDSDDKYNRILSENVKVSIRGKLSNNNMMIVGSSGSFKTTSIMHQNLLQMGSSYVVLDVKGDTQRKLGKIFEKNGYQIYSLNFKNPEQSDRYNPFEWIQTEADMLRIIKSWHDAVRPAKENSAADPFWDDAVDLKMQAVFYYAWLDARDNNRKATFNDVISLLAMENVKTTDITGEESNALADLMEKCESEHDANYPPVRAFKKFQGKASETEGSVSLMISAMLNICETGTYIDNISTIEEAMEKFNQIDPARLHGIPAIGINYHVSGTDSIEDEQVDIVMGKIIDVPSLNSYPAMRDNETVKAAVEKLIEAYPESLVLSPTEDDVMQTLNMAGVAVDRKRLDGIYSGTEDREEYLQYLRSVRENYIENDPDEIKMSYLDKAITYVGQIHKPKTSKDENKGIDGVEDAAEMQEDEEPMYSSADVITLMPNYFSEKNRDGVRFAIKNTKLNIDNPIIVGKYIRAQCFTIENGNDKIFARFQNELNGMEHMRTGPLLIRQQIVMQVFKDGVPQPPYLYASYKSDNVTEALEHYNECMGRWADLTGQTTSEIFQRAKTMENKQDVKQNKPGL